MPLTVNHLVALIAGVISLVLTVHPSGQAGSAPLPARLESYVTSYVKLTTAQRAQLMAGQPVTRLLEADASREVSVFGAVWIAAPPSRYVAAVKDIEQFEKGESFRVTRRISTPPRPEDFDLMDLPDEDVDDLRQCRVGSCELKLSENALRRMRKEIDA